VFLGEAFDSFAENPNPTALMGGYARINLLQDGNDFLKNRLAKIG
jgi:hypothetical protein